MEKLASKIIGIVLLFIALIQVSIKIFNFVNCWAGIGAGIFSIVITYLLITRIKIPK